MPWAACRGPSTVPSWTWSEEAWQRALELAAALSRRRRGFEIRDYEARDPEAAAAAEAARLAQVEERAAELHSRRRKTLKRDIAERFRGARAASLSNSGTSAAAAAAASSASANLNHLARRRLIRAWRHSRRSCARCDGLYRGGSARRRRRADPWKKGTSSLWIDTMI